MSFSCPELSLSEMLRSAVEYGYSGIEPRAQESHTHGVEFDASPKQRAEIRRAASNSGVEICCLATSCNFASPDSAPGHIEDARRAIELAADIGCRRIRVFGGKIGDGLSREEAIDLVAANLSGLSEQAARHDVFICLETHDDWCDPRHVARVMEKSNHPNIRVNWDILHPVRAGNATMNQAFEILRPWIRHVHVHDGVDNDQGAFEFRTIGTGIADHKAALRCLKDSGYDEYVSGEWIGWDLPEVHLPRELAILKQLEASL